MNALSRRSILLAPASAQSQFFRGVNFTAERPDVYGSDGARAMLRQLPTHGVDSIALVPYGFTPRQSPTVRIAGARSWESDDGIRDLAKLARELRLKVLLKPHVWTPTGFPGDLHFPRPEERRQWFDSYALFLEHYARLAVEIRADLFTVGNEFVKLSVSPEYEEHWRNLISRARRIYRGPMTYAAVQGEEFEGIRFWDALDYIGLNNYYPWPDDLNPRGLVERIHDVHRRHRKPVLFTECGFASLSAPHKAPWDETVRAISLPAQARCYEALLKAFYKQPWLAGMFFWKVGTNGFGGDNDTSHTPWRKPAMQVMARYYRGAR